MTDSSEFADPEELILAFEIVDESVVNDDIPMADKVAALDRAVHAAGFSGVIPLCGLKVIHRFYRAEIEMLVNQRKQMN